MPYWIRIIRYMGSNCLALTFIVVVVVLIPMTKNGVRILLFEGPQLFHHVICPALSVISFGLFEDGKPTHKDALFAALPTLVYAIVTVILNYAKLLDGPYPFLKVYEQSIFASIFWFISIVGISYVLAYLIKLLTKFKGENAKKDDNNTDTNNNTKITEAEEMV
ncbi:hypothetical protein BCR36DRAFT_582059 [Piromyces finnis]|uniref:Uncharacterized protein n=1 Tax=Piromyces finnis TaxID=1754191 RepID=A0A1Y1VFS1_9FUNG|nr:hypothetical protein BCR36DRAFT_582059 [Piromyces finnis]|eukprot:ORX53801.1 hypothetical protein BCR36DRAFT_582059 [Piromyces finnis]